MPNPKRFKFARSRTTTVEPIDGGLRTVCRLNDTFCEMRVEVSVKLPDLEITSMGGNIERCLNPVEYTALERLPKLAGVRVGPGMTKIFKGLAGEDVADSQILFMAEEACHGVILSGTKEMSAMAPTEDDLPPELFRDMAKANTRLIGRCAAYAADSPMVQGVLENK